MTTTQQKTDNQSNETRAVWQFITSDKAWILAEKDDKAPPYAGYLIELRDGRRLRCRKDAHKTVFEISAT